MIGDDHFTLEDLERDTEKKNRFSVGVCFFPPSIDLSSVLSGVGSERNFLVRGGRIWDTEGRQIQCVLNEDQLLACEVLPCGTARTSEKEAQEICIAWPR